MALSIARAGDLAQWHSHLNMLTTDPGAACSAAYLVPLFEATDPVARPPQ